VPLQTLWALMRTVNSLCLIDRLLQHFHSVTSDRHTMTENDITGYDINPCVEFRTEMPGIMKAVVNRIKPTKNN